MACSATYHLVHGDVFPVVIQPNGDLGGEPELAEEEERKNS